MDFYHITSITDPDFTWDNPGELGLEHHSDALLSTTEEDLEGNPFEIPTGSDSKALTDQPVGAGLLYAPEDDEEGYPSTSCLGHISHASAEPSLDAHLPSDAEDSFEGNPSELSIGHDSNAPSEPSSDDDHHATSTCSSSSRVAPSGSLAAKLARLGVPLPTQRQWTHRPTPSFHYHRTAIPAHSTAQAAVPAPTSQPAGNPTGLARHSQKPDNDQEGNPSSSKSRLPAPTGSQPADAPPAHDYEQQLTRILTHLAKLKRDDALIHVAAADSSSQLEKLMSLALRLELDGYKADNFIKKAAAAEDAWLTHLSALADSDRTAWANAHRHYERVCKERGLHAHLERAKELVTMLRNVVKQTDQKHHELLAFPKHQKNPAFTIVGKMPPVKLYQLPGKPGIPAPPGGLSDEGGHGNPCTPMSRPTPGSDNATCPDKRQQSAVPQSSSGDQPTSATQPRTYCVFCRCHYHWSSDCPTNNFHARWAFVKEAQLCQQCLRAGHVLADCKHADRRCLHCAARHHAALCPKAHGPTFHAAESQPTPGLGHPSVANAARGRSPPDPYSTTSSAPVRKAHDDRPTTTNPLDTKPPSSSTSSTTLPPETASVKLPTGHQLASAITSFFQRQSAEEDVVAGLYVRSQDNAGRTFYRILQPLKPSAALPLPTDGLNDHLTVDRVIMIGTIAHVLPRDPLLSSNAMPDADSHASTGRSSRLSACSSCTAHQATPGVVVTDFSVVAPRHATVVSELANAMRTPQLPRPKASSPATADSATSEVEPENTDAASRRSRRKRLRRKPSGQARISSQMQSTPVVTTEPPAASIVPAGPRDPTLLADSELSGNPLVPVECDDVSDVQHQTRPLSAPTTSEGPMPLKSVRTWTASCRKKPLPTAMLNDSSTDSRQRGGDAAQPAVAPGGPSAPEDPMGIDIAQKNKESGNPLILPPNKDTDASHPGNGHPSVANAAERRSPPDSATPHTAEVHHSPHSAPDTIAFGSHASGQCQKPLLACTKAYARAPSSSAAKPIIALFDSSADHSSCSTILALELQLPVSSSVTHTAGKAAMLPFLTTQISVALDGQPAVTIPVTLATMPYRSVPTSATYKQGLLLTQNGSLVPAALQIRPHIIIGHDAQHLFRVPVLDETELELASDASINQCTPLSVTDGNPPELLPVPTDAHRTPSAATPPSCSNGNPCEQDSGHRDATTTIAPAQRSLAPGGPSTCIAKSMGMGTNSVEPTTTQDAGSQPLYTTLVQSSPSVNDAAAVATLDVTTVGTAIRVDVRDTQHTITAQQTTTRDVYIMPPPPVPLTLTEATDSDATLGQLPVVANAAAALTTAPATPEDAARVAPAAQVLPLRNASSAMDFEQWNRGPAVTEGNPSVAEIPLPAQEKPPRMRTSTAEPSEVEIVERDDSSGVLSNFSLLLIMSTMQPELRPQINQQALARLYPQASQDILGKLWEDYQTLKESFYSERRPGVKAAGMANAVPQLKPRETWIDACDEDAEMRDSTSHLIFSGRKQLTHQLLRAIDSHAPSEASCSDDDPLPRGYVPHSDEVTDEEDAVVAGDKPPLSCELSGKPAEQLEALVSGNERQSSRPTNQSDSQQYETWQSEFPSNAEEMARGTTNKTSTKEKTGVTPLDHDTGNFVGSNQQAAGQWDVSDTSGSGTARPTLQTAPRMPNNDADTDRMSDSAASDALAPTVGHLSAANNAEGSRHPSATASEPRNPERSAPPRPYCAFCDCHNHWWFDCPIYDLHACCALVHQRQLCQQCFRADHRTADCNRARRRCLCCGTRHHAVSCERAHRSAVPAVEGQPPLGLGQPSAVNTAEALGSLSQPMETSRDPGTRHPWMANTVRGRSLTGTSTNRTPTSHVIRALDTLRRPMLLKAAVHRYRPRASGPGLHRPSDAEGRPVQAREDQPLHAPNICRRLANDTTGDRWTPHRRHH